MILEKQKAKRTQQDYRRKGILRCSALHRVLWWSSDVEVGGVRLPETRRRPAGVHFRPKPMQTHEAWSRNVLYEAHTELQRLCAWLRVSRVFHTIAILCICTTETLPSSSVFRRRSSVIPATRRSLELALHVLEDLGDVVLGELRWSAVSVSCNNTSSGLRFISSSQAS